MTDGRINDCLNIENITMERRKENNKSWRAICTESGEWQNIHAKSNPVFHSPSPTRESGRLHLSHNVVLGWWSVPCIGLRWTAGGTSSVSFL